MDFIIVCPHCDDYVSVDKYTIQEYDFFHVNGFELEGSYDIECPHCKNKINMTFTTNIVDYKIVKG